MGLSVVLPGIGEGSLQRDPGLIEAISLMMTETQLVFQIQGCRWRLKHGEEEGEFFEEVSVGSGSGWGMILAA